MRILHFTDIHANLPAILALQEAIRLEGCDLVVFTGDAVDIGPYPSETMEVLMGMSSVEFVRGNHDDYVQQGIPSPRPSYIADDEVEHIAWSVAQLTPEHLCFIAGWPREKSLVVEGLRIRLIHYGYNAERQTYEKCVPDLHGSQLYQLFGPNSSELVLFGHDHSASDVTTGRRYVNPGAAGCNCPGFARYCIIEIAHGHLSVRHHKVAYDCNEVLRELEQRRVPARDFICRAFFDKGNL